MRTLLCSAAMVAVFSTPAFAETAPPNAANAEIVVTATRAPAQRLTVGSSISVLTGAELQRRQAVSAVETLRDLPGVAFNRNGGAGGVASVRIRGAESDQTVVLIDGVKLNDPSSPGGGFNFANLLIDDVARVEVLRGPQSTLYGSQAIGGVINVITRPAGGALNGAVAAEIGELNSYRLRGRVAGGGDRFGYAFNAGRFQSDSISAFSDRRGGREADGYEQTAAQARIDIGLTTNLRLDLRAWWARSEADLDGFPPPTFALADTPERTKGDERIAYAGLQYDALGGRLRNRLAINRTEIERENRNAALTVPFTFKSKGVNDRLELQSTFDVSPRLQLIGGVEREEARLRTVSPSTSAPNPPQTRAEAALDSVYLQAQATPTEGLTATFGVRRSDDDRFGEAITARATLAYTPNGGQTVMRASAGDGFKAPTPFQLFSNFGNVSLQPEEAFGWDAGIEQALFNSALRAGLTYFRRDAENQIDFVSCFANPAPFCIGRPFGTYDNIARATAEGWEASLDWRYGGWRVDGAFTSLDARNRAGGTANFNRKLPRRPEQSASLGFGYSFAAGHTLDLRVSHVGASFDNAANTVRLKGYTLASVLGAYQLTPRVALYGRVENLTDEVYETTFRYGSPPRQATIGVRASF